MGNDLKEQAIFNDTLKRAKIEEIEKFPSILPTRPYQDKGISLCLENPAFLIVFDMRCGKTLTAINTACELWRGKAIKRVLVVCPLSAISVWEKQLKEHSTIKYFVGEEGKGLQWEITNYESVRMDKGKAMGKHYDSAIEYCSELPTLLIVDEIHRLKEEKSLQTQGVMALAKLAVRKIGLSGTPFEKSGSDLFSIGKFIHKDLFPIKNQFQFKAFAETEKGAEAIKQRFNGFSYRVTLEEANQFLPDITREVLEIELSDHQESIYKDFIDLMNKSTNTDFAQVITWIMRLNQITAGFIGNDDGEKDELETDRWEEIIGFINESEEKKVVFSPHIYEQKMIIEKLIEAEIPHARILGADSQEIRGKEISNFQNNKDCKVIICSTKIASEAIDLSAGSVVFFTNNIWSRIERKQAEARVMKVGSKKKILIVDLLATRPGGAKTINHYILSKLEKKETTAKGFFNESTEEERNQLLEFLK